MSEFKKDDLVTWDTWGRWPVKHAIHHEGHVFEVIPAGMLPQEVNHNLRGVASTAFPRGEESYVIYEYTKLYWPKTNKLHRAKQ